MFFRTVAVLLSITLALAGCSGSPEDGPDRSPDGTPLVSPVTGLEIDALPNHPAYVVKVENTLAGEPQYGLGSADMVVEELVEGGITRLAAVFYSQVPDKVGHVRSARGTDAGIAAPLNATVVASGAAKATYRAISDADVRLVTEDQGADGFSSDPGKHRPYNRLLDLAKLAAGDKSRGTVSPYFHWDAEAKPGGTPVTEVAVTYSGATTTVFQLADGKWGRSRERAAAGQAFTADNLVVIFAPVRDAGYLDPAGNPVPETHVAGRGRALIVVGGQAMEVTWTKAQLDSTIAFVDAEGVEVKLPPGKTWLALATTDGSVSTR